eukprot:12717082-Alexandrium_andersonii.AAC.1
MLASADPSDPGGGRGGEATRRGARGEAVQQLNPQGAPDQLNDPLADQRSPRARPVQLPRGRHRRVLRDPGRVGGLADP